VQASFSVTPASPLPVSGPEQAVGTPMARKTVRRAVPYLRFMTASVWAPYCGAVGVTSPGGRRPACDRVDPPAKRSPTGLRQSRPPGEEVADRFEAGSNPPAKWSSTSSGWGRTPGEVVIDLFGTRSNPPAKWSPTSIRGGRGAPCTRDDRSRPGSGTPTPRLLGHAGRRFDGAPGGDVTPR
jgi:hypothetical protein